MQNSPPQSKRPETAKSISKITDAPSFLSKFGNFKTTDNHSNEISIF